jgi:hypothetical protein
MSGERIDGVFDIAVVYAGLNPPGVVDVRKGVFVQLPLLFEGQAPPFDFGHAVVFEAWLDGLVEVRPKKCARLRNRLNDCLFVISFSYAEAARTMPAIVGREPAPLFRPCVAPNARSNEIPASLPPPSNRVVRWSKAPIRRPI